MARTPVFRRPAGRSACATGRAGPWRRPGCARASPSRPAAPAAPRPVRHSRHSMLADRAAARGGYREAVRVYGSDDSRAWRRQMSLAHVGYAAMLEQFGPIEVTEYTVAAEAAGFRGVMAADHFQPWVPAQGQAAFVWNVLTAMGERTRGDLGPGVTCPSFRFHPAIVAQASATLAAMYPGRHWLGLGSGEALNEHVTGGYWPEAPERLERMWEAVELIKRLFTGKDVKHRGTYYRMETVRLWTMPDSPPPIYIATAGPITAKRAGQITDGIITPGAPAEKLSR